MGLVTLSAPSTLEVETAAVTGVDAYGNDRRGSSWLPVPGCAWWPGATSEDADRALTVTSGRTVLFPVGTVVSASSRVRWPDGSVWTVEGEPSSHRSPLTGVESGPLAVVRRVTG